MRVPSTEVIGYTDESNDLPLFSCQWRNDVLVGEENDDISLTPKNHARDGAVCEEASWHGVFVPMSQFDRSADKLRR